ncbi:MAG: phosphoenolpyruvate--protein phosphotransferase [Candidatus Omnitrophica bacterium]|nr:phosphoenolpyruvate--protein phosphotransferase [Candidatus Omnitrophota bacterium]
MTAELKLNTRLRGKVMSPGIAYGLAFPYRDILSRNVLPGEVKKEEVHREMVRVYNALVEVVKDLEQTRYAVERQIGKEHAAIFEAHKQILKDEQLKSAILEELENELVSAEQAVRNVFRRWMNSLLSMSDENFRSRADDFHDVSCRLLRVLLGYEKNELKELPPGSIVIARRLLPSDTVQLNRAHLRGIVVEEGSANSHSAILARGLGVPGVYGVKSLCSLVSSGVPVLLDGEKGVLFVSPEKKVFSRYIDRKKQLERDRLATAGEASAPAVTRQGTRIRVCANAACIEDVKAALASGAEGIGLFRIEQVYLSSRSFPKENFLLDHFRAILVQAGGRDCVFRLLDIGGDKLLPYQEPAHELNPSLGLRGVRFLLAHRGLLETQIRVMLRLARDFPVRLCIPMVTLPQEVRRVRSIVEFCQEKLSAEGVHCPSLRIGTMIETPAAVFQVEQLCRLSDFLSVGTNDLIQYSMAAGRENAAVANYYRKGAALIFPLVRRVIEAARTAGIECSVCGELAADPRWSGKFVRAGLRSLSVNPQAIPPLKKYLRTL